MFEGYISEILADKLLHGEFTDGDTIIIDTNDGSTELTITKDTATDPGYVGLGNADDTGTGGSSDAGGDGSSAEFDGSIFDEPEDNGQAFNLDNVNETGTYGNRIHKRAIRRHGHRRRHSSKRKQPLLTEKAGALAAPPAHHCRPFSCRSAFSSQPAGGTAKRFYGCRSVPKSPMATR